MRPLRLVSLSRSVVLPGGVVANTTQATARAMKLGMTTLELDATGRGLLQCKEAGSALEAKYDFPGATCINVNEEVAHGIPGGRVLAVVQHEHTMIATDRDAIIVPQPG